MLSICIPVYNFNVCDLVANLYHQAKGIAIPIEIIVIDDYSDPEMKAGNSSITQFENVRYIQLDKNLGRAGIRNLLSKEAQYPSLLFLDADMQLTSGRFLETYIAYLNLQQVTIGGISYQEERPQQAYILHGSFGNRREQKPAAKRNKFPSRSMMTGNFMVTKLLLEKNPFWEGIKGYGHEDTLWGIRLFTEHVPVVHINNPALHSGLQASGDFIHKQEEACMNLIKIWQTYNQPELLIRHVSLLKAFQWVSKFKLAGPVAFIFKSIRPYLLKTFESDHPSLYLLDFYKLGFFISKFRKS
jgi:GT2 family glycosyltransferase